MSTTQIRTTLETLTKWIDSFSNCEADDGTIASEVTRNNAKALVTRFYAIFPEGKEPQIGRSANGGIGFTFHMDHDQILGEVIDENCELEDNKKNGSFKLPDDIDAVIRFIKGEAVVASNNNISTENSPKESKSENLPIRSAEEPRSILVTLYKGTEMQNAFATSDNPPTMAHKDAVHQNTKCCSFCDGHYEGLLHVVKLSDVEKGNGNKSLDVYLVPGCRSCNKRYSSTLTLKRDVKNVSISDKGARVKKFAVLRE